MANDMKSGIGFLIPGAGVIGFFTSLLLGEFLISIIIAISGILVWFLYMLVMESHMPGEMGNMIILFGILLSLGIFFGFGVQQNMWGGFEFQTEGSIFSLVILFFSVLTGLNFRNQQSSALVSNNVASGGLSDEDRELVMNAIDKAQKSDSSNVSEQPKVIVLKQEATSSESNDAVTNEEATQQQNQTNPYGMMNNPYFAYPPDYYYDEDDEDEWEDEDEDEWEDEWEDEDN